ncbi:hypothetical protein OC835_002712 [Tilletia horrida]|nr:hypothetical protein OC835_002712 [Tilletia horrida]
MTPPPPPPPPPPSTPGATATAAAGTGTGHASRSLGPQQDTATPRPLTPATTSHSNSNSSTGATTPFGASTVAAAAATAGQHNVLGSPSSQSGKSILISPPPHPQIQGRHESKPEDGELYSQAEYLVPLYVFDEREIELSGLPAYRRKGPEARTEHYGFWKTGGFRTRFVAECVYDLRSRLQQHGSDLLIRFGIPEDVIENLVTAFQTRGDHVEGVWMQKEMTEPEARVESTIQQRMAARGVPVRFVYGKTLVHPADLPFTINETPDVFTPFRKRVEALGANMVRPALKVPRRFKPFLHNIPKTDDYSLDVTFEVDVNGERTDLLERDEKRTGEISFNDILDYLLRPLNAPGQTRPFETQFHLQQRHPASAFPLRGGETSAVERLEWYFVRGSGSDSSRWGKHDAPPVARYKQTRNNLIGHAYSTKMSPFLAYGSVSPRQIWEALDAHDLKFGSNQNTYWVRFELLWRDFFALIATKYGQLLFELGGFELATDPRQANKKTEGDWWKKWNPERDAADHDVVRVLEGKTGIPFIDANITELRESGFMSNRGRQNVASFLSKDLSYDWRIGAEFFQSHLIDYDATSNYGNWQYVAGVGNDPRASRQFNIIKQSKTYDPEGEYIKLWVPELRSLTSPVVHHPWTHPREAAKLGGTYPSKPLVESETWQKHYATPTAPLRGGGGGVGRHGGGGGGGGGQHGGGHGGNGAGSLASTPSSSVSGVGMGMGMGMGIGIGAGHGGSYGAHQSAPAGLGHNGSLLSSSPTSARGLGALGGGAGAGSGLVGSGRGALGGGGGGAGGRSTSAALERAGALGSALAARNAAAAAAAGGAGAGAGGSSLLSGGPGLGATGGIGPLGAAAAAASQQQQQQQQQAPVGFGRGSSASTWFGRGGGSGAGVGSASSSSAARSSGGPGSRPSSGAGTAVDYGVASRAGGGAGSSGRFGSAPAGVSQSVANPPGGGTLGAAAGQSPFGTSAAGTPYDALTASAATIGAAAAAGGGNAHSEDVIQALTGELRSLRTALDLVTSTLLHQSQGQGQQPQAQQYPTGISHSPVRAAPGSHHAHLQPQPLAHHARTASDLASAVERAEAMAAGMSAAVGGAGGAGAGAYPPLSNSPVAGRRLPFGAGGPGASSSSPIGSPHPNQGLSGAASGPYGGGSGSYASPYAHAAAAAAYGPGAPTTTTTTTTTSSNSTPSSSSDREAAEALERVRLAEEQGRELRDQIQQWEGRVRMLVEELRVNRGAGSPAQGQAQAQAIEDLAAGLARGAGLGGGGGGSRESGRGGYGNGNGFGHGQQRFGRGV